ncbi:MAG: PP2C family protein-serine/threonine phosphatase [Acidimicrobiales bacterium]
MVTAEPPPAGSDLAEPELSSSRLVKHASRPVGVIVAVTALGLVITCLVTWASWLLENRNESHLLRLQTEQAGEVLTAATPDTETPLSTAVQIASVSGGNEREVSRYLTPYVGPGKAFAYASLWQMTGTGLRQLATVGASFDFASRVQERSLVANAVRGAGLVVNKIFRGGRERLGFALAMPGAARSFAVYAEHAIPVNRRASVASNSAFSDLNYAIYIGRSEIRANLLTTSFTNLPPTGPNAKVTVPLGNTVLTLVASPRGQLGGTLPARLPWILGILGIALSLAMAWTAERLVRRRRSAEHDASEIRRLYSELGALFGEQRTIAETLQRALLPRETPDIAGVEAAVRYVPGAKGMEIGGDWYSVIPIDDGHFGFVVGDVSGRGLSAATVMAGLRFTIRTYFLEGYSPSAILAKCSKQIHVLDDGHFATVLVGVADTSRAEITLANAGHFNPLVIDGEQSSFIDTVVGVPLGVSGGSYESVTVELAPGATLLAFTDGLVEHRGESLDVGLKRLEEVTRGADCPLDQLLTNVIADLTDSGSEDDVAMLGLRWTM